MTPRQRKRRATGRLKKWRAGQAFRIAKNGVRRLINDGGVKVIRELTMELIMLRPKAPYVSLVPARTRKVLN